MPVELINKEKSKVIMQKPQWWYSMAIKLLISDKNIITGIEIFPIDLSQIDRVGWPSLASDEKRLEILNKISKLSKRFGTKIIFDNSMAEVKLNSR